MTQAASRRPALPIVLHLLNALTNVFWTVLFLTPVVWFCYRFVSGRTLILCSCASLVPYLLPGSVLRGLRLSDDPEFYRRMGVGLVNRVTQNGAWVNRAARREGSYADATALRRLMRAVDGRVRFHLALLLFVAAITVIAVMRGMWAWAGALMIANVCYNLLPVLLQQSMQIRLERVSMRRAARN